jgi:hypothetical protein
MIMEADVVANAEGSIRTLVMARATDSIGVCVACMRENVELRNLGDPACPRKGREHRNGMQGALDDVQEVRSLHSTWEVG